MPGFRSGFKESISGPGFLENTTIADLPGQELRIKGRGFAGLTNPGAFEINRLRVFLPKTQPYYSCGKFRDKLTFIPWQPYNHSVGKKLPEFFPGG